MRTSPQPRRGRRAHSATAAPAAPPTAATALQARRQRRAAQPAGGEAPRAARERRCTQVLNGEADRRAARRRARSSRSAEHGAAPGATTGSRRAGRGPVRRAGPGEDRQDLRRSSPSSATSGTRATPTRTPTRPCPGRPASTARCTTRSPSRTARSTTRRSGRPTTTASTTRTCTSVRPGVESLKTYYERQSSGRYSVDGLVTDWVEGALQRGPLRPQQRLPVRRQRLQQHVVPDPRRRQPVGAPTEGGRAHRRADRGRAGRRSTCGTATTTTATATSTSPTATSTTSRSSTPAATRPTAIRSRARTPSGRTAGRRSRTPARARRQPRRRHPDRRPPASGSPTTRSSRRTAACRSSPTSTATTSACPTSTTPAAPATTRSSWWSLMAQSRVSAEDDQGIGTRAADLGAWEKLQLGWLDYEVVAGRRSSRTLELGPHEYNSARPRPSSWCCPKKQVVTELRRARRGSRQWWSRRGRRPRQHACRGRSTLPAGTATLTFQARWNIEDCGPDPCDYAYVEVDDGTGWTAIPGSITKRRRGQRHRRRPGRLGAGDVRPVGLRRHRRSACGSAT